MPTYEITQEMGPRACVVRLAGDLDMAVVPELRSSLGAALQTGCANVVLDLSEVIYADSSALGLLVWLDHRLKPIGGKLVLAGANRDVTRILEISGLINVAASVKMSANLASALEGLDMPEVATDLVWEREFEVEANIDRLGSAREQVCEVLVPLHMPESALFDMKVALGEALANAVRHGSPEAGGLPIRVRVGAYDDRVVVEVMDSGPGFDGKPVFSDDIYKPSGRGIHFMRALMDRVEFTPSPFGGTTVRLIKHRAGAR